VSRAHEEITRQALSQFLTHSTVRHSGSSWIEACSRDAEIMLGFDRHKFADLLARAVHARHQLQVVADRTDGKWADWFADYMLTDGELVRAQPTEQPRGKNHMQIIMPALKAKHEELKEEITAASQLDGPVGSAAREVEWLLRPHLLEEEEFGLPALEALRILVHRAKRKELQAMADMTDRLQREMPYIVAQHAVIALAIEGLASAAEQADDEIHVQLARKLAAHMKLEEAVIYPATVLVGDIVKDELAIRHQQTK
jgi:hypothetical protein